MHDMSLGAVKQSLCSVKWALTMQEAWSASQSDQKKIRVESPEQNLLLQTFVDIIYVN